MLKLDLQFFAEGDEDSLDFDDMLSEFETEWENEDDSTLDNEEVETETDEPIDEEPEQDNEPEQEMDEEQSNPNDPNEDRRNRAFADLRRQAEENQKYASFLQQLAKDAGVQSPDEIMQQYEQRRLAQEAEQKGVPLDFYQQQHETQTRLSQLEDRYRFEKLDNQIQQLTSKYDANEDSIREAFQYMLQSGVDPRVQDNVNFEHFYRAANLDSIIQREVEQARQRDLASRKERQQSAAVGNGTSVSRSSNSNDISDEEVDAILKRMDIRI